MALSYAVGAVLSVVYLNMLNRSIDAVGASEGGSAAAQPRLLIPIILAMGYNRQAAQLPQHNASIGCTCRSSLIEVPFV